MMHPIRFGIYGNAHKARLAATLSELISLLPTSSLLLSRELSDLIVPNPKTTVVDSIIELAVNSDVLFSLGGDGTMLTAARAIVRSGSETKLIGINLGRLGFLSEHSTEFLPEIISAIVDNDLLTEDRLLLDAHCTSVAETSNGVHIRRDILEPQNEGKEKKSVDIIALNEIVLDNFGSTRMLTLEIRVEGSHLGTLRADGIIVSTPTGSTGYSVSAGGPLVEPTSPVLIISPIAAHSLSVRPVIVPDSYEVDILVYNDANTPILAVADGQEEVVIQSPARISISGSKKRLQLLRHPSQSYFDLLRTKLLWSADARGQ